MARRPGLDRRLLVGEAAALADERGLDFVTLSNLAERLNVRAPSLYNHIESADELQHELCLFALQALGNEVARAAIGRNGAAGLIAIANAYRNFAKQHPGMYAATLRAPRSDDAAMQKIAGDILDVLRVILVPFDLDEDRSIHALRGFRSLVHGFVSLEAVNGFGLKQNIDVSFQIVVSSFIAGLYDASDSPAHAACSPICRCSTSSAPVLDFIAKSRSIKCYWASASAQIK
jgi:AcrR family transcriptional regulator